MKKKSKIGWTVQEEEKLKFLRDQQNIKSWKIISRKLTIHFPEKPRTGKQCRERYMNFVRFDCQENRALAWESEDDHLLFGSFFIHGSKWSKISLEIKNRSENDLKNRFYGLLRKVNRKIRNVQKILKLKQKKPIKVENLIKILQLCSTFHQKESQLESFSHQLYHLTFRVRQKILSLTQNFKGLQEEEFNQVKSLIEDVHQFNYLRKNAKQQDQHLNLLQTSSSVSARVDEQVVREGEKQDNLVKLGQQVADQQPTWQQREQDSFNNANMKNHQNIQKDLDYWLSQMLITDPQILKS